MFLLNRMYYSIEKKNSFLRGSLTGALFLCFFLFLQGTGICETAGRLYDKARVEYYQLMKQKPGNRGRWSRTADHFVAVYKTFPQSKEASKALFSAGNIYFELYKRAKKKEDLAKSAYYYKTLQQKYSVSNLSDDALFRLGKIKLLEKDLKSAYKSFKEILRAYPKSDMRKKARKEALRLAKILKIHDLNSVENAKSGKRVSNKCLIVVDPGHGGKDGGAIGVNRILEKDVTLDIALHLKKRIQQDTLCRVYLTREKDVYIPLAKRTDIANKKNATLFISIHANAAKDKRINGIETFFQGHPRTAAEKETAARENMTYIKEEFSTKNDMLGFVLADMNNNFIINESSALAGIVQSYLTKGVKTKYRNIRNLGIKKAMFYVLAGAKVPGVLTEVSFITNPIEGKRLSNKRYRELIANSLLKGIKVYIKKNTQLASRL